MAFDPHISQNTCIRIAHQLHAVSISRICDLVSVKATFCRRLSIQWSAYSSASIVANLCHCMKPYQDDIVESVGYLAMPPPYPGNSSRTSPAVACSSSAADAEPQRKPYSRHRSPVPAWPSTRLKHWRRAASPQICWWRLLLQLIKSDSWSRKHRYHLYRWYLPTQHQFSDWACP